MMSIKIELYVILILLSFIIIRAYIREHRALNKDFLHAAVALILMDVFEIISLFFPFSSNFFLHSIVVCMEIFLWIYLPYICLKIIIWRFWDQNLLKNVTIKNLMILPLIITAILSAVSPFNNLLFKLNMFGEAIAGDYYYILDVLVVLYTAAAIVVCIMTFASEETSDFKSKALIVAFFVAIMGGSQFIFGYFMSNFYIVTATISLLFLYVFAQENRIFTDPLTGLNNRNRFRAYLSSVLSNYLNVNLYLTYVDIDDFKKINDEYGHVVGDLALRAVAESMQDLSRKFHYFIARIGGDEFAIISSHSRESDVNVMIEDIKRVLADKVQKNLPELSVNLSFGTTYLNQEGKTMSDIIKIADNKMYEQKRTNKEAQSSSRSV